MYKTQYGDFTGEKWEDFCQLCFKRKYETDGYQEMPAWQGDLGIEGYTRNGVLFQCYCPDEEYTGDELYEKQRDKITADLKKLQTNEAELKKYLKDIKVTKWIFVTPGYKKKDIVKHCHDKAEEYRNLKLSILDDSFDVLIHDIEFFSAEIPTVLNFRQDKIEIDPLSQPSEEEITDWKTKQISLVDNAIRKHGQRLDSGVVNRDKRINTLTQTSVENFLNGNSTIKIIQDKFPKDYEKFIRVVSQYETKVVELCAANTGNNNDLYKKIGEELCTKLKEAFAYIDQVTIDRLTEQVMADWILRCPINFE
jgi:hypothetical protein